MPVRSCLPPRYLVRSAKRDSLADAATGDELWFGDELLAKVARLARGRHLASDPLLIAGLAGPLRAEYEQLERLNRARNFFGDPSQRYDDRLRLEGHSYIEHYCSGQMALVLHYHPNVIGFPQSDSAGFVHEPNLVNANRETLVIFKADTNQRHKLQHWNEQLVFVPNIQIVKATDEWIPSRVGFYVIQDKVANPE